MNRKEIGRGKNGRCYPCLVPGAHEPKNEVSFIEFA
jgi:hypothetical protein